MSWTLHEPHDRPLEESPVRPEPLDESSGGLSPEQTVLVRRLKEQGSRVIAARSWHYPLERQRVIYQLSSLRPCTLLEAFILRAAELPQPEPVDIEQVADLLGLDAVFIEHATASLATDGLMESDALPAIRLTSAGRSALASGQIAEQTSNETLEYLFDRKFGAIYARAVSGGSEGPERFPAADLLEQTVSSLKAYINKGFIRKVAQALGRDIGQPAASRNEPGQAVTGIVSAAVIEPAETLMSEVWIMDESENRPRCQVWDHARGCWFTELAAFIETTPGAGAWL